MIHSENALYLLGQILRQTGADYMDGRDKIEGWKQDYIKLAEKRKSSPANVKIHRDMFNLREKMNDFWSAEEFWFDYDNEGETPADAFWEKWALNWAGWDIEYFRRMVKEGKMLMIAPKGEGTDAYNKGTEQMVGQGILGNSGSWERGDFAGSDEGGTFRTGSGDCGDTER